MDVQARQANSWELPHDMLVTFTIELLHFVLCM